MVLIQILLINKELGHTFLRPLHPQYFVQELGGYFLKVEPHILLKSHIY